MTSSYTVPKNSNGMQVSEHIPGHDKHENELQSIADLPKFLQLAIYFAPTRWKKTYMTVATLFVIGISIPIFSYILSSLATGIVIGAMQILMLANKVRQPDFTKGIFLDILLKDAKVNAGDQSRVVALSYFLYWGSYGGNTINSFLFCKSPSLFGLVFTMYYGVLYIVILLTTGLLKVIPGPVPAFVSSILGVVLTICAGTFILPIGVVGKTATVLNLV